MIMSRSKVIAGGLVLASASVLGYLSQLEKQELVVYADKLAYGIPTVCSGYTDWSLKVGQAYTKADCDKIDRKTAEKYGLGILNCAKVQLNQNQLDALTLFAVNVGIQGACNSRAIKLINAGQYADGCRAISRGPKGGPVWSFSGGKFRQGLANRRAYETALCLKPVNTERASA
jgi:lysozyme